MGQKKSLEIYHKLLCKISTRFIASLCFISSFLLEIERRKKPKLLIYGQGVLFLRLLSLIPGSVGVCSFRRKEITTEFEEGLSFKEDLTFGEENSPEENRWPKKELVRVESRGGLICHFSDGTIIRPENLLVVATNELSLLPRLGKFERTHYVLSYRKRDEEEENETLKIDSREENFPIVSRLVKSEETSLISSLLERNPIITGVFGTFVPFSPKIKVLEVFNQIPSLEVYKTLQEEIEKLI